MAKTYAVYEAKAKLSAILREVKRGRRVTISERGTPVAVIGPVQRRQDVESRLEDMEQAGLIHPALRSVDCIRTIKRRPGALRRFLEGRD